MPQHLTKKDLVEQVYFINNISLSYAQECVEAYLDLLKEGILERKTVYIKNIGSIASSLKSARPGRNPKTGEEYTISERYHVGFKQHDKNTEKFNHSQLIDLLVERKNISKNLARQIAYVFKECLDYVLENNTKLYLRGLGTFSAKQKTKVGDTKRNPKTGETFVVTTPTFKLHFKCSKQILDQLNNNNL